MITFIRILPPYPEIVISTFCQYAVEGGPDINLLYDPNMYSKELEYYNYCSRWIFLLSSIFKELSFLVYPFIIISYWFVMLLFHAFKSLHLGGLKLEICGTHIIPTRPFKRLKSVNIVI